MKARGRREDRGSHVAASERPVGTPRMTGGDGDTRGGDGVPLELAWVWLLFAVVAVAIVATYARIPAHQLYHVSRGGLAGGFGRASVFLNFPVALAAIGVVLVVYGRLVGGRRRGLALLSLALCAVVAWPGVVEQADLDAKPVNALPALGVALALALMLLAARDRGFAPLVRTGRWRIPVAAIALALSLPWIAAELGFYLDGVPVLGRLFLTDELRSQPGDPQLHPAVHHGHHHGMDGALLVVTALLLVPTVRGVSRRLRPVLAGYVALMFCYGVGNLANDAWLEQVVKRGWTSWEIPGVTVPRVNGGWGVILLAALIVWLVWRLIASEDRSPAPPAQAGATTPE
jgi:hypothetical protein